MKRLLTLALLALPAAAALCQEVPENKAPATPKPSAAQAEEGAPLKPGDKNPASSTPVPEKKKPASQAGSTPVPEKQKPASKEPSTPAPEKPKPAPEESSAPPPEKTPEKPLEQPAPPAEPAPAWRAEAALGFGCDFYRPLAAKSAAGQNVALSPICLSNLLDLLLAGSVGKTSDELRRVLNYPANVAEAAPASALLPATDSAGLTIRQATGVWVNKGFEVKPDFQKALKNQFGAAAETLDLTKPAEASGKINEWVGKQTEGKITKLVSPGEFTKESRMAAVSALYFKAAWVEHFDPAKTKPGEFKLAGGKTQPISMMEGDLKARYTSWPDGLAALAMDFQGGNLTFLALLPPDAPNALAVLESSITPAFLHALAGSLRPEKVQIQMPRFSITASAPAQELLAALGADSLFKDADFSAMTSEPRLAVSSMNHQVAFAVDEAGAEGAAAASAVVTAKSVRIPVKFVANRPFVFLVLDRESMAPLLIGRVANPSAAAAPAATDKPAVKKPAAKGKS